LPRAGEVTRKWEIGARSGNCRNQLQDYVAALQLRIQQRQEGPGGIQELQNQVEDALRNAQEWEGLHCEDDHFSPTSTDRTPGPSGAGSFGMSMARARSGMGDMYLEQTSRQQRAAVKAKHLIQAAASGDVAKVQSLLRGRADLNIVGWGGSTPLMAAARHGREGVLNALLTGRADIAQTDGHGRTAVDHAQQGRASQRSGIVSLLRGHGGMSGMELKAHVDVLARRVCEIESEWSRLNDYKGKLPSSGELAEYKALLQRTETRKTLIRRNSRTPIDLTPRASPQVSDDDTPSFSVGAFKQHAQNSPSFGMGTRPASSMTAFMSGQTVPGGGLGMPPSFPNGQSMPDGYSGAGGFSRAGLPPTLPLPMPGGMTGEGALAARRW